MGCHLFVFEHRCPILDFHISHNTLCLLPKFCLRHSQKSTRFHYMGPKGFVFPLIYLFAPPIFADDYLTIIRQRRNDYR